MRVKERRFDVKLTDPDLLVKFMAHADPRPGKSMSMQDLADAITLMGVPTSKGLISHLTSGRQRRTSDDRAKAIEKILNAPRHMLFVPEVSTVSRDVAPRQRVA